MSFSAAELERGTPLASPHEEADHTPPAPPPRNQTVSSSFSFSRGLPVPPGRDPTSAPRPIPPSSGKAGSMAMNFLSLILCYCTALARLLVYHFPMAQQAYGMVSGIYDFAFYLRRAILVVSSDHPVHAGVAVQLSYYL